MMTTPIAQGPVDCEVRALPPQHPGQARTMLICETKNTVPDEVGHWYSPEKVAELIAAEREACAKVCDALSEYHGYVSDQDDWAQFSEGYKSAGALECAVEIRARSNAGGQQEDACCRSAAPECSAARNHGDSDA